MTRGPAVRRGLSASVQPTGWAFALGTGIRVDVLPAMDRDAAERFGVALG